MDKEKLIKLSNNLRLVKKYFCAYFDNFKDEALIVNEDSLTKDEKNMNLLKSFDIDQLLETNEAIRFFLNLTENFVRFINDKNIENDIPKIKVCFFVSYFLEKSLKEKFNQKTSYGITYNCIKKSDLTTDNILDNVVKISMSINADLYMLDENDFEKFENDFVFTPSFIIRYSEFIKELTYLGYDIEYKNFDSLISRTITNCDTILELTTIDLEPEKVLKK